jgi:argininosuccinate lyase
MADPKKTWGGRFRGPTDARMERFSTSVNFDRRLWRQDIRVSMAHVRMLARQGILDKAEAKQLVRGLEQVARAGKPRTRPRA